MPKNTTNNINYIVLYVLKIIILIIFIYFISSTVEWIIHRYIMHDSIGDLLENENERHITHHIAATPGMSLDISTEGYDKLLNSGHEQLCLSWYVIVIVIFVIAIPSIFLAIYMKINIWIAFVFILIVSLYALSMWNNLHPSIHKRSGYELNCALAVKEDSYIYNILVNSSVGQFLKENHIIHHNIKDPKTNFNITLPLADYLYGTHSSYIE
jgi:hypothetical protein